MNASVKEYSDSTGSDSLGEGSRSGETIDKVRDWYAKNNDDNLDSESLLVIPTRTPTKGKRQLDRALASKSVSSCDSSNPRNIKKSKTNQVLCNLMTPRVSKYSKSARSVSRNLLPEFENNLAPSVNDKDAVSEKHTDSRATNIDVACFEALPISPSRQKSNENDLT